MLTGSAQQVLTDFHNEEPSYIDLSTALEARFGPVDRAEVTLAELRNRQRKPNESLQEHAQSNKRLTNLAYPEVDRQARDRLARIHFADAIADKYIKIHLFQARLNTLEDAVRVALEADSFYEAEKMRGVPTARVGQNKNVTDETEEEVELLRKELKELKNSLKKMEDTGRVNLTYFNCGKKGHIRRDCRALTDPQRQGNGRLQVHRTGRW